jgi:uncharacterized protein YdaU (DUF1376 family)
MPLYIGDYAKDTRRLTTLQHGAYILLIMDYWCNGGLPDDDGMLARIAGLSDEEWRCVRIAIAPLFRPGWHHKRIDEELKKASEKSRKAKESACNRWKDKVNLKNAKAMQTECYTSIPKAMLPQPLSNIKKEKIYKKEKVFKHELPEGWQPDESDLAYGKKLGLLNGHFEGQLEALRLWAKANKILKVDWHATLKGFLRRDAEKHGIMATANGHDPTADPFAAQVAYWRKEGLSEERIEELKARLNG